MSPSRWLPAERSTAGSSCSNTSRPCSPGRPDRPPLRERAPEPPPRLILGAERLGETARPAATASRSPSRTPPGDRASRPRGRAATTPPRTCVPTSRTAGDRRVRARPPRGGAPRATRLPTVVDALVVVDLAPLLQRVGLRVADGIGAVVLGSRIHGRRLLERVGLGRLGRVLLGNGFEVLCPLGLVWVVLHAAHPSWRCRRGLPERGYEHGDVRLDPRRRRRRVVLAPRRGRAAPTRQRRRRPGSSVRRRFGGTLRVRGYRDPCNRRSNRPGRRRPILRRVHGAARLRSGRR